MTKTAALFVALALSASLALAGCNNSAETAPSLADAPLAGAKLGGPFELLDKTGKTVRWADFEGQYRMVYFGYTFCPDVCPYDVQRMMQGYDAFKADHPAEAARLQPIFISIDPERDTPEKVGEFASAFSDDLLGLTGTQDQVEVAAKAFAAYYKRGETNAEGIYLMDHSRGSYLMGPQGQPIALVPVEESKEAVATELARWVR